MPAKKYFLAIVLAEPVFSQIEVLKQALFKDYNLKGALRSPAHITLHRPFEWKEEKEDLLIERLKQFEFTQHFEIELKDFAFFEPRVIYVDVLPNIILNELHGQLTQFAKRELKLFNEAEDLRGFHPHVTVAFRDLKKKLFYELQSSFSKEHFDGLFNYSGFSLLKLEDKWEEHFVFKNE